ncbi:Pur_DNA_glyco domain-containing protein, partial [Cephalotus follicularis]
MMRTQRFKRVTTNRKKTIPNPRRQLTDDFETRTSQSVAISVPKPEPSFEKMTIMSLDFFQFDALHLAPRLLGKYLRRDNVVLQITEVEAYRPNDSACHGRFGITARTAPVFGPGGHAYVYLCYGLHTMLNIVADKEGVGAAVLIRSCAPVGGLETIQQRRGQKTIKPMLLTGPGKV